jgi:hypothetical protein
MNFKLTSAGTETGALPTLDCVAAVVEKPCDLNGCESAGTRKDGTERDRTGSLKSCSRQRCEARQFMAGWLLNEELPKAGGISSAAGFPIGTSKSRDAF